MQSDSDFVFRVRAYILGNPDAKAIDIVNYFYSVGEPKEKTLYTLREIIDQ